MQYTDGTHVGEEEVQPAQDPSQNPDAVPAEPEPEPEPEPAAPATLEEIRAQVEKLQQAHGGLVGDVTTRRREGRKVNKQLEELSKQVAELTKLGQTLMAPPKPDLEKIKDEDPAAYVAMKAEQQINELRAELRGGQDRDQQAAMTRRQVEETITRVNQSVTQRVAGDQKRAADYQDRLNFLSAGIVKQRMAQGRTQAEAVDAMYAEGWQAMENADQNGESFYDTVVATSDSWGYKPQKRVPEVPGSNDQSKLVQGARTAGSLSTVGGGGMGTGQRVTKAQFEAMADNPQTKSMVIKLWQSIEGKAFIKTLNETGSAVLPSL